MRYLMFAVLAALFALPVSSADAGIVFNSNVDLNFSTRDGSVANVLDVDAINFGIQGGSGGRIAANGTDSDGDGFLSIGDSTNVVGHALIDQITFGSGSVLNPLDGGGEPSFNLTAVLRNVTGEIANIPSFGGGFNLGNDFNGGFVDFYLDVTPETPFDPSDLSTSTDDGLPVATFSLVEGETRFLTGAFGSTRVVAELIDNSAGFFGITGSPGLDPTDAANRLTIEILSQDSVLPSDTVFLNIDNSTGNTNIGPDFDPAGAGGFDVISSVDGNATFGVVPEPTSFVIFSAIGLCGLVRRRNR